MNNVSFLNRVSFERQSMSFKPKQSALIQFNELVAGPKPDEQGIKPHWHTRAITYLNDQEVQLDKKMPNHFLQNQIDQLGSCIEAKFAPLKEFNSWLDSNGEGKWYQQLAIFLIKLPARAVRNIIRLLYNFIEGALCAAVHPLKSTAHLAKILINLVHELTKPETWSKIGMGMLGSSLGQGLVTGNPLSVIGLGVGTSLLIGGLSVGALKAAIHAEKGCQLEAAGKNLLSQAKELPETALTGFCMGLIIGGIQRALYKHQMKSFRVSNGEEARQFADSFIKEHHLPQYSNLDFDSSGKIVIQWEGSETLKALNIANPKLITLQMKGIDYAEYCKIELCPNPADSRIVVGLVRMWYGWDDHWRFTTLSPLDSAGFLDHLYPLPPVNINLSQCGSLAGTAAHPLDR